MPGGTKQVPPADWRREPWATPAFICNRPSNGDASSIFLKGSGNGTLIPSTGQCARVKEHCSLTCSQPELGQGNLSKSSVLGTSQRTAVWLVVTQIISTTQCQGELNKFHQLTGGESHGQRLLLYAIDLAMVTLVAFF